ncbi:Histone acetyltransferase kat2b [Perkinsus olseni]|uniref:Histone acetyltransferase kat2b n=1 Tax=Perkinsus olseni TaxID=32597 RepID=A0A7J6L4Y1_PEROL|nr:Histone acetyltransferase kat2b [Perkinsus olseni]
MSDASLPPVPRSSPGLSHTSSGGSVIDAQSYVKRLSSTCDSLLKERIRLRYGGKKPAQRRQPHSVSLRSLDGDPGRSESRTPDEGAMSVSELRSITFDSSTTCRARGLPSREDLLRRAKLCLQRLRASGLDNGPDAIHKQARAALAIARYIADDPRSTEREREMASAEFMWAIVDADLALKEIRAPDLNFEATSLLREAAEIAVLARIEYADFLSTGSEEESLESRKLRKDAMLLCRSLKRNDGQPVLEPGSLARRLAEEAYSSTFYSANSFNSLTLSSSKAGSRPAAPSRYSFRPHSKHRPRTPPDASLITVPLPSIPKPTAGAPKRALLTAPRVKPRRSKKMNPFLNYEDLGKLQAQKRLWLYTDDDYIRARIREFKDDIAQFHRGLEESDPNALYEQVVEYSSFGMKARVKAQARHPKVEADKGRSDEAVALPKIRSFAESRRGSRAQSSFGVNAKAESDFARKLSAIEKAKDLGTLARIINESTALVENLPTRLDLESSRITMPALAATPPGSTAGGEARSEASSGDAYETPLSSTPADLGITFELVSHANATEEKMLKLLVVKNIFSRQLPRMPKAYLSRLMFDSKHETMVMIRGDSILGGCCFRQFQTHFIEIAFLAVRSVHQIQGNGTRLMNHMKEYAKSIGVHYFLTYADNHAIGYFKRQGFTKHLSFPKAQWNGFIKDYDGGSLMGCKLFENINYLALGTCLEELAQKVWDDLMHCRPPEEAYEGLDFSDGVAKGATAQSSRSGSVCRITDAGCSLALAPTDLDHPKAAALQRGRRSRLEFVTFIPGQYQTREQFIADIDLMRENCITFNGRNSEYTKRANEVHEYVVSRAKKLACYISEASVRSARTSQATTPESSEKNNTETNLT